MRAQHGATSKTEIESNPQPQALQFANATKAKPGIIIGPGASFCDVFSFTYRIPSGKTIITVTRFLASLLLGTRVPKRLLRSSRTIAVCSMVSMTNYIKMGQNLSVRHDKLWSFYCCPEINGFVILPEWCAVYNADRPYATMLNYQRTLKRRSGHYDGVVLLSLGSGK